MKLPDKVYEVLKWIVVIFLPALNVAMFGLGELYGFDATIICGTISIITTFIGALIGVSTYKYRKSQVSEDE